MSYCIQENGMNQPLTIQPDQVTSYPPYDQTTPQGDINPTSTTPGLNFSSPNPQINITLNQPASLTVIYIPTDRPNQPTNVDQFVVVFVYPNGTTSPSFTSQIPSTGRTATTTPSPSTGVPSQTSTTPIPSGIIVPSDVSPQVDLPPNFQVPNGTIVVINITSTTHDSPPIGVCFVFLFVAHFLSKYLLFSLILNLRNVKRFFIGHIISHRKFFLSALFRSKTVYAKNQNTVFHSTQAVNCFLHK